MRQRIAWILVTTAMGAGCGTDPPRYVGGGDPDAGTVDTGVRPDVVDAAATPDVPVTDAPVTDVPVVTDNGVVDAGGADVRDASMDAGPPSVASVRAAITGTMPVTLAAPLADLVVTARVTATPGVDGGVSANDPAGFFVQSGMTGPAIFVAVDPATLTPSPAVGDRVSFTATEGRVSGGARWITAVRDFARAETGVDTAALRQDLSAATDLVTALDSYEHELVRVQGTVAASFSSAGTGFESAQITTAGVTAAMTNLRVRVAAPLRMSLGLRMGCTFTVTAPLWRFNAQAQVHAWSMGDIADVNCPPIVDAGTPDAGPADAGTLDAGALDAGPADSGLTPVDGAALDAGAEPAPTVVWALRVSTASSSATAVFLDRIRIADGMNDADPIALPIAMTGSNRPFSISGSATGDGQLTRSLDRRYVVAAGYAAVPGTATVADGNDPRVVARVSADGSVDTSTLLGAAFAGHNVRSAATTDGAAYWVAGDTGSSTVGGLYYAAFGANAAAPVIRTPSNVRFAALYDGTVYGTISQSGAYGVFRVNGTVAQNLSGFPTASGPSRYGFVAFDRDSTPGIDVIYQCDDSATGSGGGVHKYTLSGDTWTAAGPYNNGLTTGCRGITGFVDGGNVTLLITSGNSANRILRAVDTGAAPSATTFAPIRTAPSSVAYRGIVLAPR